MLYVFVNQKERNLKRKLDEDVERLKDSVNV
jgi:hypothetical protein